MTDRQNIEIMPVQASELLKEILGVNASAYKEFIKYGNFLVKALKNNPNAKVKEMHINYSYFTSSTGCSVRIEETEESTGFVKDIMIKDATFN